MHQMRNLSTTYIISHSGRWGTWTLRLWAALLSGLSVSFYLGAQ